MTDENKDFDGIKYRVETRSPTVFRVLLTVLVLWALCFMGYYLFGGWSSQAEFAEKQKTKVDQLSRQPSGGAPVAGDHREGRKEDYVVMGKKEFAERCASCHGPDARGGIGPDLTRKQLKYGRTEAALTETISNGRPGGMPAFGHDLSHEKIEGLVQYILSL